MSIAAPRIRCSACGPARGARARSQRARLTSSTGFGASVLGYAPTAATRCPAPLVLNPQGLEEFGATDPRRARLKRARLPSAAEGGPRLRAAADRVIATDRALEPVVRWHLGLPRGRIAPSRTRSISRGGCAWPARRDGARMRRTAGIADDEIVLLSVGRLEENKGFHVLAAALGALRDHATVIATAAGDGCSIGRRALTAAASSARSLQQVSPTARSCHRPCAQTASCMRGTRRPTLFVHPTLYEGSSLVTLEAMAHRRAVVATVPAGCPTRCGPACNGWLVPAGDASALAAAISGALADPARLAHYGRPAGQSSSASSRGRPAGDDRLYAAADKPV